MRQNTRHSSAGYDRAVLPDRYQLRSEIGSGGMGRVWRAHDSVLGRDVAIKMIERGVETKDRGSFVREARAAARLHHTNIAVVHDVDPEAGWLVMELVEGGTLRAQFANGPVPAPRVMKIAAQVLAALDAAHAAGVIHRDIKPSNIMLGAGDVVKLVDFGIARLVDVELTDTSNQSGTPAYMAPEQIRGAKIDDRTDLYSLGATLFEAVVGERISAFEASSKEARGKLYRACSGAPGLAYTIERCLQIEPADRFACARDAAAALGKEHRTLPVKWIALAAGVIAVSSIAGVLVGRRHHERDPRVERAFLLAQRGENDKALHVLADYITAHHDDADAQTTSYLATWWQGGAMDEAKQRLANVELRPAQRALVEGVDLIAHRRDIEAVAFLQNAAKETPGAVEIEYALGEAQWHSQQLEAGATTLAHAFSLDPRWEMALHHVIEYRLSRGEGAVLAPIVAQLRAVDAPAAAALDCEVAIGERDYPRASALAKAALDRADVDKIPELYVCLAQAQALVGDFDAGAATAKIAFELWPLETHDSGGFAQYAEFSLYKNQLDTYLDLTRGRASTQRALAILLWRPDTPVDIPQPSWPAKRMAPLGSATWLLQQHLKGADASAASATYPEPEVKAWAAALAAEGRGDRTAAVASLRQALTVPAKGDMRMLVAHHLAKLLLDSGDAAGAAAACDEVIRPRFYVDYRAILLRDCVEWSKR